MKATPVLLIAVLVGTTGSAIHTSAVSTLVSHSIISPSTALPDEGELPSLAGATLWLNSQPLTPAGLRGKVVLIDFSTYTCINWLRTLSHVRAWAEKYKDQGLVVINVQTPEFEFEKNIDNVRLASKQMGVVYPTAIDNDYAIWNAFDNHYWPALYIVDAKGRIRHHHFGEGDYEQSEKIIKQLLTEAGQKGIGPDLAQVHESGAEVEADWSTLKSGETYVGYDRAENFSSPGGLASGKSHVYSAPAKLELNHWALDGDLDGGEAGHGLEQGERADRVSISRPRSASRNGAGSAGIARALSRAHRWSPAGRRARCGCRRPWATAPSPRSDSISLFGSRVRSPIDSSRSSFSIRARRRSCSRSADSLRTTFDCSGHRSRAVARCFQISTLTQRSLPTRDTTPLCRPYRFRLESHSCSAKCWQSTRGESSNA